MLHEIATGGPDVVGVCVDGCEDIEQMFDIRVLRCDPPRLFVAGLVGINFDRQPTEVTILGRAEEWGCHRIFRTKIVSEWRKHRNKSVVPIRQREDAEFVEDVCDVGNVRE